MREDTSGIAAKKGIVDVVNLLFLMGDEGPLVNANTSSNIDVATIKHRNKRMLDDIIQLETLGYYPCLCLSESGDGMG